MLRNAPRPVFEKLYKFAPSGINNTSFSGGGSFGFNTGSSPALSANGEVLYLGDANGNVAALDTTTGIDNRKMLIWAFLGSECMFFGSLIATYLVNEIK